LVMKNRSFRKALYSVEVITTILLTEVLYNIAVLFGFWQWTLLRR